MDLQYRQLIRKVMRTFYDIPKSLIIEYIYLHDKIKEDDLAKRLCLDPKQVRSYIQEFKRDKFIIEDHRLESNEGNSGGRRTQDQYYYKIDMTRFVNVVKYRLIHILHNVENFERQQTYKQSKYKCEKCAKEYTELDIGKLYDLTTDTLICSLCGENVHEDIETKEITTDPEQIVTVSLFYEQMQTLFEILQKIDELKKQEQQFNEINNQNGNSSLISTNHQTNIGSLPSTINMHRSHASNVFDRTATINHNVEIFIERDDDDHYSPMDIDETNHIDSLIGSSRGPGKPGKKHSKIVQSTAEVAIQPISAKMKVASKKVSYEPKPIPHWFTQSTVYIEQEEARPNHSTNHTTTISRQISNSKITKSSSSINDIKQMLLAYESRKTKTLPLTPMEDSLSPPTPIQITKTTDSQ